MCEAAYVVMTLMWRDYTGWFIVSEGEEREGVGCIYIHVYMCLCGGRGSGRG